MDAIAAARSGMYAAASRFGRASERQVRARADGAADARVDQIEAALAFRANARAYRAAEETARRALDILA